jgi:hypothetical protein
LQARRAVEVAGPEVQQTVKPRTVQSRTLPAGEILELHRQRRQ